MGTGGWEGGWSEDQNSTFVNEQRNRNGHGRKKFNPAALRRDASRRLKASASRTDKSLLYECATRTLLDSLSGSFCLSFPFVSFPLAFNATIIWKYMENLTPVGKRQETFLNLNETRYEFPAVRKARISRGTTGRCEQAIRALSESFAVFASRVTREIRRQNAQFN